MCGALRFLVLLVRDVAEAVRAGRGLVPHSHRSCLMLWTCNKNRVRSLHRGQRIRRDEQPLHHTTMDRYVYRPLDTGDRNIRLVRLLPDADSMDIRCEIIDHTMNARRPYGLYEALSYCWGDASNRGKIFIKNQNEGDERYLAVTTNLLAALHQLRNPTFPRILWVDAICINQDDLAERAEQVNFMATIYVCASQVLVWLGNTPDNSSEWGVQRGSIESAFETIRECAHSTRKMPNSMPPNVARLLSQRWFSRVWVSLNKDVFAYFAHR
jgi:hypothetical protein